MERQAVQHEDECDMFASLGIYNKKQNLRSFALCRDITGFEANPKALAVLERT